MFLLLVVTLLIASLTQDIEENSPDTRLVLDQTDSETYLEDFETKN